MLEILQESYFQNLNDPIDLAGLDIVQKTGGGIAQLLAEIGGGLDDVYV